ncbi:hypothetical protein AMAG_18938 [Allomyces macrogynus ATCC 38327]|uniref:AMP-dependent synthetase/ligase domain-containing protein n=1 Tax=Allomyces macrogynus (strain ATCC 38327) TaxID=578462 RepID=A0A0L0SKF6_ALLM3|nr:hypothetical protein AMAG_18938 [Allomyces macrogynus ATCC 38327]|eukprot:KNE62991.1 hypothetical protein AMAG_18938 [Allomyces macrogynus ATCC 38327]
MMVVNLAQAQAFAASLTSGIQSDGLASMKLLSDNAQGTPMACSGFFHLSGTLMGMATAVQGGTMYFMEEFDAGKWLGAIARLKIGQLSMTPHNLVQLIKHPRANEADLSPLKLVFSIAAPLSAPTQVRIMKGLKAPVVQSYASTETLNLTSPRLRLDKVAPPGEIGWLIPGMEAVLIDPETLEPIQLVKDGVTGPGEIIFRGPNLFTRYFHRPQETEDAFIEIGGKSWYRMGDLCTVDKDGCLSVVDRSKEMIKTGGNTVIPTEIEALILRLPNVADVVVVPVPGGDEQVVPCAAVVPQDSAVLNDTAAQTKLAKDITDLVAQELAAYKYLTGGVVFLDAVPRTVTGKILRRAARTKVLELLNATEERASTATKSVESSRKPRNSCSTSHGIVAVPLVPQLTTLRHAHNLFMEDFDAGKWLDAIEQVQIGQLSMAPNNLVHLIKHPRASKTNVSSLTFAFAIGSPLSAATQVRIMQALKIPVVKGYALTETLNLTVPRYSVTKAAPPGSIGWFMPGVEAMLLHLETREPLERIGGKPWNLMGDVCVVGKDRCLSVVDRTKEIINVAGNTLIPSEIEAHIIPSLNVLDVAALAAEVNKLVTAEFVAYEHLTGGVVFLDAVPRNATGKIVRRIATSKARELLGGAAMAASKPFLTAML